MHSHRYGAALLLEAYLSPLAEDGAVGAREDEAPPRSGGAPVEGVPLATLYRQHAWASVYGAAHETPTLNGAQWQAVLERWAGRKRGVALVDCGGTPVVAGVRRVHPSERTRTMAGWDAMRLLESFGVSHV